MKILLFRDGQAGGAVKLPGDEVQRELEELLGGEIALEQLNERLKLVRRADGENLGLPVRYVLHRIGRAEEPVPGDCAIMGTGVEGCVRDISVQDIAAAQCYIQALNHRAGEIRWGGDQKIGWES